VDRFSLLTPALVLAGGFVLAFFVYGALHLVGRPPAVTAVKHNQLFGPFVAGFLVWLIRPAERLLVGRISPNAITVSSVALCGATGVAAALGELAWAVWLYVLAGILDVLDGRVARHRGRPLATGALFDSVSDRWGEWFVFSGYAWYLHSSLWLLAVMGAIGGSMMVSYTRARAEGLGLSISSGMMQRAERIVLVAGGTLIAAWQGEELAAAILGGTMMLCAVASSATALNRWVAAHRALAHQQAELATPIAEPVAVGPARTPARAGYKASSAITGA
jgi:phosphatidylglycerophosphate synthase